MFRVYGHLVDRVCSVPSSAADGASFAADKYKPLSEAYRKPSTAKKAIYADLKNEFSDAIAYGVTSHNCNFFTFEACFEWGYITVYPTRRVAGFWRDTPLNECIAVVLP